MSPEELKSIDFYHNSCKFNPMGVICEDRPRVCEFCGWNPKVVKERKQQLREKAKTYMPLQCIVERPWAEVYHEVS